MLFCSATQAERMSSPSVKLQLSDLLDFKPSQLSFEVDEDKCKQCVEVNIPAIYSSASLKVKEKRVMLPAKVKAKKNLQRTQKLEMHQLKMQHPPKVLMLLMLMLQQWKEQVGGQNSRLKLKHQKMEEQ